MRTRAIERASVDRFRRAASNSRTLLALEVDRHFGARADGDVGYRVLLAKLGMPDDDVARADRYAQIADRHLADALAVDPYFGAVWSGDVNDALGGLDVDRRGFAGGYLDAARL